MNNQFERRHTHINPDPDTKAPLTDNGCPDCGGSGRWTSLKLPTIPCPICHGIDTKYFIPTPNTEEV